MDWNTLLSVALGGLIATIGVILTNRFQARERAREREEARRESKIQAREKWIERDALKLMDLLDTFMNLIKEEEQLDWSQVILEERNEVGLLAEIEYLDAGSKIITRITERIQETDITLELMERLVYSFRDENITSSFQKFRNAWNAWTQWVISRKNKEWSQQSKEKVWLELKLTSGEFHHTIREMLISLRDT